MNNATGARMLYTLARSLWLFWNWLELAAITLFLYVLSFLPRSLRGSYYFWLYQYWARFFVRALGVDLRLHQKNIHPLPEKYILIANHPSALEDVGIPALFPVRSLAKEEVRDWWWAGRINEAADILFVKRESKESRHQALEQMEEALNRGYNLAIYPEGGCKGRRLFTSFRFGAFDVSLKTGVPILPVFIHYEAQQDFEWQPPFTLLDKMWHFMTTQNNRANYYVFDAIDPADFQDKESYNQYVYNLYLQWQAKYLE